jgi:hypothetical protein
MIEVLLIKNVFAGSKHAERIYIDKNSALVVDLLPAAWHDFKSDVVPVSGVKRLDWEAVVHAGDRVGFVLAPRGIEFTFVGFLKYLAIMFFANVIIRSLMPKPPKRREDNTSATYGFNGVEPTRVEGEPIPLYYGEVRVGGQIINEFVEDYGALGSSYLALVSLGEGPLQEIAGQTVDTPVALNTFGGTAVPEGKVFLNDTDVTQLQAVEVAVRMGTIEQDPIEGFELASSIVSIDTDLGTPTTTAAAWEEIINYAQPWFLLNGTTLADPTFDTSAVAYNATIDADGAVVKVLLPEGVGYINDDNVTVSGRTGVVIRYIRLDGSGAPITSGGQNADGYVYLRPIRRFAKLQGGASMDFPFTFYNPATFALGTITGHMSFNGGGQFQLTVGGVGGTGVNAAPTLGRSGLTVSAQGPSWQASSVCDSFSIECFFFPRDFTTPVVQDSGGSPFFANRLAEFPEDKAWISYTGGAGVGFALGNKTRSYSPQAGQSVTRYVPYVSFGGVDFTEGSDDVPFFSPSYGVTSVGYTFETRFDNFSSTTGTAVSSISAANNTTGNFFWGWQHAVATYEKNASGNLSRVRLYINGVKIIDRLTTTQCTLPSASGTFTLRGPGGHGYLKNVAIYKGVMSQADILTNYNNGNGRTRVISSLFPVAVYQTTTLGQDTSGNSNTLTNNANLGVSVTLQTNGAVIESGTGSVAVPLRARYRIEVLRAFKNSTSTRFLDAQRYTSLRFVDTQPYSYPSAPLLAVTSRANAELNGSLPAVTSIIKGRKVPVWDGTSTGFPTFNISYSNNPAWVVVDMLLNKDWGLGNVFDNTDLDIGTFQEWADHCDELVYNQSGYIPTYSATTSGSLPTWYDMYYDAVAELLKILCPAESVPDTLNVGDTLVVAGFPPLPSGVDLNGVPLTIQAIYRTTNPAPPAVPQAQIWLTYTGAAPWASTTNLSATVTPAGTWTPKHARFSFDGAVDEPNNAWDTITQIASSARGSVVRDGRRVRVAVHKPRPVVQLVGNSQVLEGSFEVEYLNPKTRFNQIEIGFLDRALNYDRSMVSLEHPSIGTSTDTGLLRRKSFFQEGVVRRAQIMRQALFLLNQENEVRRKGKFVGSIDLLDLEPMDVIRIAHDVVDRGISGRIKQTSSLNTQIYLDRTVVLAAATTYKLSIRSGVADSNVVPETLTVSSAAGTYAIGTPINVSTGFTYMPQLEDVYTLVKDGDDLLAQIESISLTAQFQREITWSEYVESVYDVEDPGETPDIGTGMLTATSPSSGRASIPMPPDNVVLQETIVRSAGGTSRPRLLVTWTYDETNSDTLGGFDIYVADTMQDQLVLWEMRTTVGSAARACVLDIEQAAVGNSIGVSVVARSVTGQARTPDRSSCASIRVSGRSAPPTAPTWDTSFSSSLDGEQATYRFTPGSLEQSSTIEIRRGCWLLGQRVGAVPQDIGKFGPTVNWTSVVATSVDNFEHLHGIPEAAPYLIRAVSEKGKWSTHATMTWSPAPIDSEVPVDFTNRTFFSASWEDFGIGWRRSGAVTPNATLTNCQVTTSALFPQGYLEFTGSNLTATYETADPLVETDQRAEWFYNSAFCVAEQIWPTTWADATYSFDDVEAQWTWEGPLNTLENGDDPGRVSLKIEFRTLNEDDTYSGWQAYTPGKVRSQHVQWRLSFTRPTTSYQIRIYRFSTQLLRIPRQRFERSGIQYFAEHQIFGRT